MKKSCINWIILILLSIAIGSYFIIASQNYYKENEKPPASVQDEIPKDVSESEKEAVIPPIQNLIEENKTDEVFAALGEVGLNCEVIYSYDESEPNYYISGIDVKDGESLPEDKIVHVTVNVNDQWAKEHAFDSLKVEMISVIDCDSSQVIDVLKSWNIKEVEIETEYFESDEYIVGQIIKQSVEPGELVEVRHEEGIEPTKITLTEYGGAKDPSITEN